MEVLNDLIIKMARFTRDLITPPYPEEFRDMWIFHILPYLPLRDLIKMRRISIGWKRCIEMLIQQEQGSDNRFSQSGIYGHEFFNFGYWALTTCGIPNLDERDFSLNSKIDQIIFTLRMPMDIRYDWQYIYKGIGITIYIDIIITQWQDRFTLPLQLH